MFSRPRTIGSLVALLAVPFALAGCDQPGAPTGPDSDTEEISATSHSQGPANVTASETRAELAVVRRATARYQDVRKAVADGFVQFSPHVPGMGIHYLDDSAIGMNGSSALDHSLDPSNPEILVYVDDAPRSPQRRLVAAEYAVPKEGDAPPSEAVNLFSGADAGDWHVHPSVHELPLSDDWTVHGECHYRGGIGVFLAENPEGDFVLWTPPTGPFGSWSGTVEPGECPSAIGEQPLPELLIAHGKWWTLHAWVWYDIPEGVFHATNPRVTR